MKRNSLGQFTSSFFTRIIRRISKALNNLAYGLYHKAAYFFFALVMVSWGVGFLGYHINQVAKNVLLMMAPVEYVNAYTVKTYAIMPEEKKEVLPPILARIAKCESPKGQYNKDGSAVRGKVTPSDIGKYQISEVHWGQKAHDLGFDLYTEEGNEQMALWIYKNYGTEPWYPSKKCWK